MNDDILKGKWKQLKGTVKQEWGKLTDDELEQIDGSKDKLIGRLQEKYGYSKDIAEKNLNKFLSSQKDPTNDLSGVNRSKVVRDSTSDYNEGSSGFSSTKETSSGRGTNIKGTSERDINADRTRKRDTDEEFK